MLKYTHDVYIGVILLTEEALKRIERIANAIQKAGFDPLVQLYGYYLTGRTDYITRQDNARTLILQVEVHDLEDYLESRTTHAK